ncbi:hypothetical protein [Tolypothrix bouteillei]|nr:hypothetical protein [Tolypothrix bouteillei]
MKRAFADYRNGRMGTINV